MAKPTPSAAQTAAINTEIANANAKQTSMLEAAVAQNAIIARKQLVDDAFKDLFAWYNDSVIKKYDAERKAINGSYILAPIVEADITGVGATPPTGRLIPTYPALDVLRIPEFDGTVYTSSTLLNEIQHLTDQLVPMDILKNGVAGGSPTITGTTVTTTALTSASTTLTITDVAPITLSANDILVIYSLTDAAIVKINSITPSGSYDYALTITMMYAPFGTISSGAGVIGGFSGFSNSDRTAKIAANVNLQPLMDHLIVTLQTILNARSSRLTEQLAALNANEDPYAGSETTTAITNANNAAAFITAYLISTDISDTGLSSLTTENSTRSSDLATRISQIISAYTTRTENFYNQRYNTANNRGNLVRGTIREVSNSQNVKDTMNALAAGLVDQAAALASIL